ncbi:hypothetical protein VM1G_07439 [Cytospora mali]|uniref:Uncharacterized protein n=1 Tax=Cytospora mali TaxID=578113 RepID=A0A194W7G3_CYTMA|nr:hypothetical protein VM1G_07439 [Valsa mali]
MNLAVTASVSLAPRYEFNYSSSPATDSEFNPQALHPLHQLAIMDNPEDLAHATKVELQPFLEEHGAQAAELEQADLEQWPSESACSTSGARGLDYQTSFFKSLGLINAIGLLLNLAMAVFVIAMWVLKHPSVCSCNDGPWSPARDIIQWEDRRLDAYLDETHRSSFVGDPSPQIDTAWDDMMLGMNMRLSTDDMQRIGATSLMLSDGSGN